MTLAPSLPTTIDADYSDDGDPSRKIHQQHHDALHQLYDQLVTDNGDGTGTGKAVTRAAPLPVGQVDTGQGVTTTGGIRFGGEGPGTNGIDHTATFNPAWEKIQASRIGAATELQVYSAGYGGLATSTSGGNTLTWTYGSMYGDRTELYVGMPIGWNGRLYLINSITDATHLTVKNMDGTTVTFPSATSGVIKIAYIISEGTCDVASGVLTRRSGDPFHTGYYYTDQVRLAGTWYPVSVFTDTNHVTVTGSPANGTGVAFKQISVGRDAEFTLFRLQGVQGGDEDTLTFRLNTVGQARIDTDQANLPSAPWLVFGTGVDPSIPASVDFNTQKQHLMITDTGEVIVGANFVDRFKTADLDASMYFTPTTEKPKLGVHRYSATAEAAHGATRMTITRFGGSFNGSRRYLDVARYNNFFAPSLQARIGNGGVTDFAAQPEGGNLIVGGNPATTATSGWLWISSCAGAPTGVPTATGWVGPVPVVYDTTNHKLWVYDSGWKGVVLS